MAFDFSALITDRSQGDLDALRNLLATPMEDWTADQLAAFSRAKDGGAGGKGGDPGEGYWEQLFWPDGRPRGWDFVVTKEPGPGHPGVAGGSGFVMVTWDKPDVSDSDTGGAV